MSRSADTDAEDQDSARHRKKIESEVVQRIAISHVVTLSSIGDLSVKGPALLRNMFDTLNSLSSGVSMSSSSARCVLGLDIYSEVFGNFLLVLVLPLLVALAMKLYSVARRQQFKSNLLVPLFVFVVYLKYSSVLQSLMSLCKCTESIFGVSYLVADIRVRCFDETHLPMMVVAVVVTLVAGFSVFPSLPFY
jgi:hypothetical protein